MRNQTVSAFVCLLVLGWLRPAIAQVMTPQTMLNGLGANCDRTTEITYRSQVLASPDNNILVRAEGLLRKRVHPDSELRSVDTDNYCYPDTRETVSRQIVLQTTSGIRKLVDIPYEDGYILYQPRAFSADSRFLALDMHIAYTDGNTGSYVLFLDTNNDTVITTPNLCDGLIFQSHVGFTADTEANTETDTAEAIVRCQGGLQFTERYESVNLLTGSVRPLTTQPEDAAGYGNIIRSFEVLSVQLFE